MSPSISYVDSGGNYREVADPDQQAMQQGFAAAQRAGESYQQNEQFQARLAQQQAQFDEEMALARGKVDAKNLADMQAAAEDDTIRRQQIEEQGRRMQMTPEQLRDEDFLLTLEQVESETSRARMIKERAQTIQEQQYHQVGQQAIQHVQSLEAEGAFGEGIGKQLAQEIEAKMAKGLDITGELEEIQKKKQEHTQQLQSNKDWEEVLGYSQQAISVIPRDTTLGEGGATKQEIESQLLDLASHESSREGVDPWELKAKIDQMLAGPAKGILGTAGLGMTGLDAMSARVEGEGQQRVESVQQQGNAMQGYPGADPGGHNKMTEVQIADMLGEDSPSEAKKKKASKAKKKEALDKIVSQRRFGP